MHTIKRSPLVILERKAECVEIALTGFFFLLLLLLLLFFKKQAVFYFLNSIVVI